MFLQAPDGMELAEGSTVEQHKANYMGVMLLRDQNGQRLRMHGVVIEKETIEMLTASGSTTPTLNKNERLSMSTILLDALKVKTKMILDGDLEAKHSLRMADQTSPVTPYGRAAFSPAGSVVASQPEAERSPLATRNLPTFGEGKEAAGGLAEEAATARSPLATRNLPTFGEGKETAGGPADEV